jgi:hypothetical protein
MSDEQSEKQSQKPSWRVWHYDLVTSPPQKIPINRIGVQKPTEISYMRESEPPAALPEVFVLREARLYDPAYQAAGIAIVHRPTGFRERIATYVTRLLVPRK